MGDEIRLIPVLELEPGRYAKTQYPTPQGSGAEDRAGWTAHWKRSLADAGITDLDPFPGTTWMVSLEGISEATLRTIVVVEILEGQAKVDPDTPLDHLHCFSGGYVLRSGSKTLIHPQCCGDLSNLQGWKDAARHLSMDWTQLWIGHPSISVRSVNGVLELSDYHEPDEQAKAAVASVPPDQLLIAAERALGEAQAFKVRLIPILKSLGFDAPDKAAASIVGELES